MRDRLLPRCALLALFALLASVVSCSPDRPPLTIACAASAAGIVEELAAEYELASGIPVRVNAGASSTLALQIEEGAHADLFLSAHREWIEHLGRAGLLDPGEARVFARNGLVVVGAPDGPERLPDPPAVPERIAVADPAHVPLGRYTREALEALDRWETWSPRFVPALDASAATVYVATGEAPFGILYRTDARARPELRIVEEIDPSLHEPIELLVATLAGADPRVAGLLEHLVSRGARARLVARGFLPVEDKRE